MTLAEIKAACERGEFEGGKSFEQVVREREELFSKLVARVLGEPTERVKIRIFDSDEIFMPGKVGMTVDFDPPMDTSEEGRVKRAVAVVADLLGSRPPIYPPKA